MVASANKTKLQQNTIFNNVIVVRKQEEEEKKKKFVENISSTFSNTSNCKLFSFFFNRDVFYFLRLEKMSHISLKIIFSYLNLGSGMYLIFNFNIHEYLINLFFDTIGI